MARIERINKVLPKGLPVLIRFIREISVLQELDSRKYQIRGQKRVSIPQR